MRFTPRTPCSHSRFRVLPTPSQHSRRGLVCALLLAPWFLCEPGLADDFDLALHNRNVPVGELSGHTGFGPIALAVRHSEYLGYLNRSYLRDDKEQDAGKNPLVRRTRFESSGSLELDTGTELPLGAVLALDEWNSGDRELRVTGRSGLHLNGLRLDHTLTVVSRFAADGTESRRSSGGFRLRGAALRGTQEGTIEYDAMPIAQITRLGVRSDWRLGGNTTIRAGLTHRPLTQVSRARFGFNRSLGAFDMSSDIVADSTGAYSLGISVSLDLGAAPETAETWRLSSMLTALRAERRPPPLP